MKFKSKIWNSCFQPQHYFFLFGCFLYRVLINALRFSCSIASLKSKAQKNKMKTAEQPIEYRCLIRATNGKKTISTSVCLLFLSFQFDIEMDETIIFNQTLWDECIVWVSGIAIVYLFLYAQINHWQSSR